MSPGGRSEQIGFLRQAIARISAGCVAAARGNLCEVLPAAPGDAAAATAFAVSLASRRAGAHGAVVWISDEMTVGQRGALHAPGLGYHGLTAAQIVLVRTMDARQTLWTIEEALRSPASAVVIGEVWDAARHCDLTVTRRFLLAARAGGGLGILLHAAPAPAALSTAARQRFEVCASAGFSRPSAGGRKPVFGAPAWQVRQLKGSAEFSGVPSMDAPNDERKASGAALSQPLHPRRARA